MQMCAQEQQKIEEFKMSVYEMPIYKEHYTTFLELIKELDYLKVQSTQHRTIIDNTYEHLIKVFPLLNAGYNFWSMKGKLEICIKI